MDIFFTIVTGLGFRVFVDSVSREDFRLAASLVGLWEGFVIHHFLSTKEPSLDHLIACAFRLCIDFVLTRNFMKLLIVVIWTCFSMVLSEIVAVSFHTDDRNIPRIKTSRTLARPTKRAIDSRVRFHTAKPSPPIARVRTSTVNAELIPNLVDTPQAVAPRPSSVSIPLHTDIHLEADSCQEHSHAEPSTLGDSLGQSQGDHPARSIIPIETLNDADVHQPTMPVIVDTFLTAPDLPQVDIPSPEIPIAADLDLTVEELPRSPKFDIVPFEDSIELNPNNVHSQDSTPTISPVDLPGPQTPTSFHNVLDLPSLDTPVTLLPNPAIQTSSSRAPDQHCSDPTVTLEHSFPETIVTPALQVASPPLSGTDNVSTGGSELISTDQESIITAGDRDFIMSRADTLREQAIAEERARDRLNEAMRKSFREGRIRAGLLLEGDREEAEEKSRRLHEKAAHRYFHGTLPLSANILSSVIHHFSQPTIWGGNPKPSTSIVFGFLRPLKRRSEHFEKF